MGVESAAQEQVWRASPDKQIPDITNLAWSPDGSEILVVSRSVWSIRSDGSGPGSVEPVDLGVWIERAAWSPDGSSIALRAFDIDRSFGLQDYLERREDTIKVISLDPRGDRVKILVQAEPWNSIDNNSDPGEFDRLNDLYAGQSP